MQDNNIHQTVPLSSLPISFKIIRGNANIIREWDLISIHMCMETTYANKRIKRTGNSPKESFNRLISMVESKPNGTLMF